MAGLVIGTDKTFVTPVLEKGVTPTGTINITADGVYNVANYGTATVDITPDEYQGGSATSPSVLLQNNNTIYLPSGTGKVVIYYAGFYDVGSEAFMNAYYAGSGTIGTFPTGADTLNLDNLTQITGYRACYQMCRYNNSLPHFLHHMSMNSLQRITGEDTCRAMFEYTALSTATLPNLVEINGKNTVRSMFAHITSLTTLSFPKLEVINGEYPVRYLAGDCTSLTSVSFPVLHTVTGTQPFYQAFNNDTSLTSISFPSLKTVSDSGVFTNMTNKTCTVHFPSNLSSYGFPCGINATVLYDLPATA